MLVNEVPEYTKDYELITLSPSDNVGAAVELFIKYKIGIIPVVEDDKLIGVFSERDVLKKILVKKLEPKNVLISEVMTTNPDTTDPHDDVLVAILSTIEGGYRHLLIADKEGKLLSVLSHRDLAKILWQELKSLNEDIKYTLEDIVELRNDDRLVTLSSADTVGEAVKFMVKGNFGAVPIIDDGKIVGIISERDVINRALGNDLSYEDLPISEIMTKNPDTVTNSTSIRDIFENMVFKRYRHLLITDKKDGSEIKSILSLRDFVEIPYDMLIKRIESVLNRMSKI